MRVEGLEELYKVLAEAKENPSEETFREAAIALEHVSHVFAFGAGYCAGIKEVIATLEGKCNTK